MEYRYRPTPANKNATWLLTAFGLLALAFLGLGMGNLFSLRSVWHLCFLVLGVAALFVFLRYFSSYYLYAITSEWGVPTLVISHVQGKRHSTHCRLTLSHLLRVVEVPDPTSPEGRAALAEFMAERVRYAYLATIGKTSTVILYGREGGQRFAIRIEADAAFMAALAAAKESAGAYTYDAPEEEVPLDE